MGDELYSLVYKDTEAKLYKITEEAPLKPPKKEEDKAAYLAQKEAYVARWKPVVDAAYAKEQKKVWRLSPSFRTVSVLFLICFLQGKQAHELY